VERRSLRELLIILRERVWIALPLALIISIGIGYYQAREVPMYAASATMQFEKPETVVTAVGVVNTAIRSEIDLNTYLQVFNSQRLRSRVAESFTQRKSKSCIAHSSRSSLPGKTCRHPSGLMDYSALLGIESIRNSFTH